MIVAIRDGRSVLAFHGVVPPAVFPERREAREHRRVLNWKGILPDGPEGSGSGSPVVWS